MPHPDFESLTDERFADLQAAIAQGRHVQFAGRTASSMEELEFAIEAASKEDESALAVSNRAAVLGGPRVPITKADLYEALGAVSGTLDISGITAAISVEIQPIRDLAEAVLSSLDKDARIVELSNRVAVLEAENAQLRAAGTVTLEVKESPSPAPDAPKPATPAAPASNRSR